MKSWVFSVVIGFLSVSSLVLFANGDESIEVLSCHSKVKSTTGSLQLKVYGFTKKGPFTTQDQGTVVVRVRRLGKIVTTQLPVSSYYSMRYNLNIFSHVNEKGTEFLLQGNSDEGAFPADLTFYNRKYAVVCQ